jgi:siroheme synthase-like protein
MKTAAAPYYPVFLNVAGARCVVIGGGQVARRKVETLLELGATVKVVSPEICPELEALAGAARIAVERRRYEPGDLDGMFIAIAATNDNRTNAEIAVEARQKSVLLNVVDDAAKSNFIVPSLVKRGDITIAISTAGSSPALARKLRTRLESQFGEAYGALAVLASGVRAELKQRNVKVSPEGWQQALDIDTLISLIEHGETRKAKTALLENLLNARLEE